MRDEDNALGVRVKGHGLAVEGKWSRVKSERLRVMGNRLSYTQVKG